MIEEPRYNSLTARPGAKVIIYKISACVYRFGKAIGPRCWVRLEALEGDIPPIDQAQRLFDDAHRNRQHRLQMALDFVRWEVASTRVWIEDQCVEDKWETLAYCLEPFGEVVWEEGV